jgi:hypothetical protein
LEVRSLPGVLQERFEVALLVRGEHRGQQAREALVEVFLAEGEQAAATFGARADHAAFAEHSEVVGEGGLREAQVEGAAGALVAVRQLADDLEARRVAQRVEYGWELQLLARWVMWLSHADGADKTVVESSTVV